MVSRAHPGFREARVERLLYYLGSLRCILFGHLWHSFGEIRLRQQQQPPFDYQTAKRARNNQIPWLLAHNNQCLRGQRILRNRGKWIVEKRNKLEITTHLTLSKRAKGRREEEGRHTTPLCWQGMARRMLQIRVPEMLNIVLNGAESQDKRER